MTLVGFVIGALKRRERSAKGLACPPDRRAGEWRSCRRGHLCPHGDRFCGTCGAPLGAELELHSILVDRDTPYQAQANPAAEYAVGADGRWTPPLVSPATTWEGRREPIGSADDPSLYR